MRRITEAPVTYGWLLLLFVTTRIQRAASRRRRHRLLQQSSTNIAQLQRRPTRVMFASLLWLDGRRWYTYVPLFAAILEPGERVLGRARYLTVGHGAHVIATITSQALLARSIRKARAPRRSSSAHDVGVSYFLLGIAGALCAAAGVRPRRYGRVSATAAVGTAIAADADFTTTGHCIAFLVGTFAPPPPGRFPGGDPG